MARGHDASVRAGPRAAGVRSVRLAALVALLLAGGGCLRTRGTPDEPVIVSLEFEGVKEVDESALRAKLATRASDRFAWGDARRLDPDALALDRRRVVAFYKERGYYRAAVEDVQVLPEGDGRVRVVIRVREGSPVHVARLDIEGLDAAPEARAKAGSLALGQGQVFTWAAFDATRVQLQSALATTGYATGTVTQAALVRGAEGAAEVTYKVEAGPRLRFGPISVIGTAAVPEKKVVAQAARQVKPGDWFDERRLERIQARVFELGVFSGVRVSRGPPDPELGTVPVVVSVREAPFHTLRLGPGLGFEPSRWEALGQVSWTHRNWLGDLRQLKLDLHGGYAWIPDPFAPIREGVVGKASAEFTQPGVFGDAVDLSVKIELEKDLQQAYGSFSEKVSFGTPFRPAPRWTVVPSYNLEIYQLSDVVGEISDLPGVQNCPQEQCLLSYLEQRVTWDLRDHPLVTTEGLYLSLSLQEGFPAGGLGYTYFRFVPEVRYFTPLGSRSVLAARARLGAIVPINESGAAPIVSLFTAGGAASMRGYGVERLSPMVNKEGIWVPTGGNGVLEASVEVRRKLSGNLVGALFLDAGNVSEASGKPSQFNEVLDLSHLQFALGVGIRYVTSVGPIRADLGCRLPNDLSAGVPFSQRFPTVPGDSGHREPILVFHASLGEAY
ncbi:BamA/OMP85 family outer membrane protein [Anaeromyxobacter oryzae]|uniref:Membrane protein n=1 Tax=Anaeromyxobacter oryzae TaxID=2918170 RepID=A0ABN6MXD4_9BACT|nr:BamA/TamA family outer membrane protein [Anaeromyxobacter oryzae]BDG05619.1 membrane protein [Anaeromyxobacter oryzae]